MFKVTIPAAMNEAFAHAFNSRSIDNLLSLYEPDAALRTDSSVQTCRGKSAIAAELGKLLQIPGVMVSRNNFCVEVDGLALLRADYSLTSPEGKTILAGSSAEVVRRQADGSWLYVIDHAAGASLPSIEG
ncbi:YybH family protein [Variovorax paradoxus]|uniref:YybH family protein n=1 Tax=Variovorax paradoxus TaxID=34073 RepID=UPI0029C96024|nr:nuclear transport factor 2 family protein [Variovorax paradoxus]